MTPDEQAQLDDIERKRRHREALLLLLLLGTFEQARRFATQAVRHGFDPFDAVDKVLLGRPALNLPGLAPKLANAMAEVHQTAAETVTGHLPETVKPKEGTPGGQTSTNADKSPPSSQSVKPGEGGTTGRGGAMTPPAPTTPASTPQTGGTPLAPPTTPPAATTPQIASGAPSKAEIANAYRPFATSAVNEIRDNVRALVQDVLDRVPAGEVGTTINAIVRTMNEAFEAKGYTPKNVAQARAQAITFTSKAWSAGAFSGWSHPAIWTAIAAFAFVTVRDEHVCPICEPRDGLTLGRDDPYWLTNWAGLHWLCRCLMKPVFGAFTPTPIPKAPPPQPGFGLRPDKAFGYTFNATR